MKRARVVLVSSLCVAAFGACQPPAPTTPSSLPARERPVLSLKVKPGAPVLRIPRAALVERGGFPGVFVLSEDSRARFRLIRAGNGHPTHVEILSGLRGDETLVLGDLTDVHDGSPVIIARK